MIKIIFLISLFFIGCVPSSKVISTGVNFNEVLKNENLSDSEKIIELQIQLSKQSHYLN